MRICPINHTHRGHTTAAICVRNDPSPNHINWTGRGAERSIIAPFKKGAGGLLLTPTDLVSIEELLSEGCLCDKGEGRGRDSQIVSKVGQKHLSVAS